VGKYIHVKFTEADDHNIDVGTLGFVSPVEENANLVDLLLPDD